MKDEWKIIKTCAEKLRYLAIRINGIDPGAAAAILRKIEAIEKKIGKAEQ